MSVSRRSFMVSAALASIAAGASAPVVEALALVRPQKSDGPPFTSAAGALTFASFSALVGETFRVRYTADGWPNLWLETRLAEVVAMQTPDAQIALGGECFRIVLESSGGDALQQGCYAVDNEKLGTIALLLVPGGDTGDRRYTAVFNHAAGDPNVRTPRRR